MALQSNNTVFAADAYTQVRAIAASVKSQAQSVLASLQAGPVSTSFLFNMLSGLVSLNAILNNFQNTSGLNAFATSMGYVGTMTSDITATLNAATAVLNWMTANWPTDSGGFIQAYKLNADGTLTQSTFTSAQTAGLQTQVSNLIATIS